MQVMQIDSATAVDGFGADIALSDRMNRAIALEYVASGYELHMIQAASNDPAVAANPRDLFALQTALADYTKRMTVAAGLANHATKTIETLLKS